MHLACLRGDFPRPWTLRLGPGLTVIHDRSDGGGSTVRSALNDLVLPDSRVHEADVTGVDGTLVVAGREVPLAELLMRVPGLIPVRMPRASALHPPPPAIDRLLDAAIDEARKAVAAAEVDRHRAEREWRAGRIRWAETVRVSSEERVVAARSMGIARARLAMAAPVAGPVLERGDRNDQGTGASLEQLARERVNAARAACTAAEAAHAEAVHADANALRDRPVPSAAGSGAAWYELSRPADADRRGHEQLAAAVATVEAHPGIDAVEAAQVAVEWERIRSLAGEEITSQSEDAVRLRAARERLTRARRELRDASQGSGFDPADVELLEATHAEILAAWEAGEDPAGGRARLRLDEARAAEQAVLARMSLTSYADYMAASADREEAIAPGVEAARRNVAAAEQELSEVEAALRARGDRGGAAFTATLRALRARATELLGEDPGDDVAGVLRERIASDPLPDLLVAMAAVGVPVDRPATREQVVSRARRWIEQIEADDSETERPTILAARDAAPLESGAGGGPRDTSEPDRASARAIRAVGGVGGRDRVERARAAVVQARAELAEAEAVRKALVSRSPLPVRRPARDDAPDPGRLDLESRAARVAFEAARVAPEHDLEVGESDCIRGRAEARVALAQTELAALEELRALRAPREKSTPRAVADDLDEVVWRFLAVVGAGVDDFPVSGAGPAPVILREPFGSLSPHDAVRLCEALVGPSLAVQILLITARIEVVTWAARAGSDVVSVVNTIWAEAASEVEPGRERAEECVPTIVPADDEEVP